MISLQELAARVNGSAVGNLRLKIAGVSEIQRGKEGTITFLSNLKYKQYLLTTEASAVFVTDASLLQDKPGIVVKNPQLAIAQTLAIFQKEPSFPPGIHSTAIVHDSAQIGSNVHIGPYSVIEKNTVIGDGAVICAHGYVGENATIGKSSFLFPKVTIYHDCILKNHIRIHSGAVIGCDGYGFVTEKDIHHKIPQNGNVILEDNIEIGANCTIDRATIGSTILGEGTKLDNQVHIAHNVRIGKGCLITGQVGIAGSVEIGNFCIFAGHTGIAPHVVIGDRAVFAAKSGVTKSLPGGKIYAGMPAREIREQNRKDAVLSEVKKIKKRLNILEEKIYEQKSKND